LNIEFARQSYACKLFDINHVGFMKNFGYKYNLGMDLYGKEVIRPFADRSQKTGNFGKSAGHRVQKNLAIVEKTYDYIALN